jgi:creatinine amidohydrolase
MPDRTVDNFPVMEEMTVQTVGQYLQRKRSIVIPIGITEQHGYHLPLNTDALIATRLAYQAGLAADVLVAPTVIQSFSGGSSPGTINISPAVMSQVIGDTLISLVSQGFRNFYLFVCHGGSENTRALNDALRVLLRSNPAFSDVLVAVLPVWKMSSKGMGWDQAPSHRDWHAGWLETSMVMALEPRLVRMDRLELDEPALLEQMRAHPDNYQMAEKIVDDPLVVPRLRQRPDVVVGVMGEPHKANVELGRKLVADIVGNLSRRIQELDAKADGIYRQVPFVPAPLLFD